MCCEKLNVHPGALQRMRWVLPSQGRGPPAGMASPGTPGLQQTSAQEKSNCYGQGRHQQERNLALATQVCTTSELTLIQVGLILGQGKQGSQHTVVLHPWLYSHCLTQLFFFPLRRALCVTKQPSLSIKRPQGHQPNTGRFTPGDIWVRPRAGPNKRDARQVVVTRRSPAGVLTCPLQLHQS